MTPEQHKEHERFFTWAVNLLRKNNLLLQIDHYHDNYQVAYFGELRLVYHTFSSTGKGVYLFDNRTIGSLGISFPELPARLQEFRSAIATIPLGFRDRATLAILLSYQIPS